MRYLAELEEADSAETGPATPRVDHLTQRLASLRGRLWELEEIGRQLQATPDEQISLTDPDARAIATGSDHRGVVGYNVQAAVDTEHHIVVANAVNRGHDRSHLLEMATAAKAEIGAAEMIALADRGYYEGEQIRSCTEAGIIPMVPKPNTSPAQARGFWGKAMFAHEPETDTYRCPAGEQLQKRFSRVEGGKLISVYFNQRACGACASRPLCTAGKSTRRRTSCAGSNSAVTPSAWMMACCSPIRCISLSKAFYPTGPRSAPPWSPSRPACQSDWSRSPAWHRVLYRLPNTPRPKR
jgi:hypothetical protein